MNDADKSLQEAGAERLADLLAECLGVTGSDGFPGHEMGNRSGDRIGPYKLLEQIGEGGYGVVYMAEQVEPIRRRVALKVIKLGMDTRQVVGRFEAERQALALMDHPHIAKVLDAGATEQGQPYFVMELVRGGRITDYCDQKKLDTKARLNLFMQVCQAVQHAHQKGIIHRDLKPSNILVTLHDGVPVPKVIDFGIAKATAQPLTDKTVFTSFQQFIGTPAYMSPEQAEMSGLDIDTRSDIYSLGVLLYELLTGRPPFETESLLRAGLDEMRREIRAKEPPRPSTRLSTMSQEDLAKVAQRRQAAPPTLLNLLRGDLDWIVMKCLEKDRTRRYETANGLALDLQRHLGNEPIVARPTSNFYRLQKLVQRNRLAVAATVVVSLTLIAGICVSSWQAVRARKAEHLAQSQRQVAEDAAHRAESAKSEAENAKAAEVSALEAEAVRARQLEAALKSNYVTLTMAQYYSRNYAAVIESANTIKEGFGEKVLQDDLSIKRAVRVSAWMNPVLGKWQGQVQEVMRMLPGPRPNTTWAVTRTNLTLFELEQTEAILHLSLPAPLLYEHNISASTNGTLWLASGSQCFRLLLGASEWETVLDLTKVSVSSPGEDFGITNAASKLKWLQQTGIRWPITGLAVSRSQEKCLVALGGNVLLWIDLATSASQGWWFGSFDPDSVTSYALPGSPSLVDSDLVLAPNDEMAVWTERRRSKLDFFEVKPLRYRNFIQDRTIKFLSCATEDDGEHFSALTAQGGVIRSSWKQVMEVSRTHEGMPEYYGLRQLATDGFDLGCFDFRGRFLAGFFRTDRSLVVTTAERNVAYSTKHVVGDNVWRTCCLQEDGCVWAADAKDNIFCFDGQAFGSRRIELPLKFELIRSSPSPYKWYAIEKKATNRALWSLSINPDNGRLKTSKLAQHVSYDPFAVDPLERYWVLETYRGEKTFKLYVNELITSSNLFVKSVPEMPRLFPQKINFSRDGSFVCAGGDWGDGFLLLRTSDWSVVRVDRESAPDAVFDSNGDSVDQLLRVSGGSLIALDPPTGKVLWQKNFGTIFDQLIPWGPPPPERNYWAKDMWGRFSLIRGLDGALMASQLRWEDRIVYPHAHCYGDPESELIAFATPSGEVQICSKLDIDSVFDPRSLNFGADQRGLGETMAFDHGAHALAILNLGDLYLLETDRWKLNMTRQRVLESLLGDKVSTAKIAVGR
jgi:serine/threonine protein kinase